ncbi:winged helix-turn-helix domain-containing protein [Bradyrhizobium sp. NP1]|uniref:ATP-binding protein n=1 Tax=Bradyrhizobium sp. NP1 TaxID=3049772 RepID=UPI0025A60E31|nr:winged helix-turn-helix domain-containing protein [Bradyrhizobium sp. NP1]WJR75403.1 winged helix-turn-helix domain-containing protein [Bradyrhizobium sp. NP1]
MTEESPQAVYASNEWEIDLTRREARSRGVSVPIGSRAFEILEILVRSGGELISKYRLMEQVWPGAVVEENTLQFHISAIRKALGADRGLLKTVSGRGYRLLGRWSVLEATEPGHRFGNAERNPKQPFRTNVPIAGSALIGRSEPRQHLLDVLSAYRVVTLTGPGGIGKSVLALEVARSIFPTLEGDCWIVELASLSDQALVPAAVSVALGLRIAGSVISAESVARALDRAKLLLVLDNCEHLIDAAAKLAETIVRLCPNASVLATSREILRIEGEYAYRVPPLDVPPSRQDDKDVIREYSAVQLFNARLIALDAGSSARPENLPLIAAICRRLDGIPLAIEFAAARVATLGLQQTTDLLGDRFSLLTAGRRTALPRHQTLRATLDWSYELLPEAERTLLRRLAICAGGFTLEAATAVMGDDGVTAAMVAEGIASLAAKSLVSLDASAPFGRWRLLETIRAYALDKLAESGEAEGIAHRHGAFFRDLFALAAEGPFVNFHDLPHYVRDLDNIRAALGWAFSRGAEKVDIGIGLAVAAGPVLLATSMLPECHRWSEQALLALDDTKRGTADEMRLQAGLGYSLMFTGGGSDEARAALDRSLFIAEDCGEVPYQMWLLSALNIFHFRNGNCRLTLQCAKRSLAVAKVIGDPAAFALAHFVLGNSLYLVGDLKGASGEFEAALQNRSRTQRTSKVYFGFDVAAPAAMGLASTLCLQGYPRQATEQAHLILEDALHIKHSITLSLTLIHAVLLFLWTGDLQTAEKVTDWYISNGRSHSLALQVVVGRGLKALLAISRGDSQTGVDILQGCVQELRAASYGMMASPFNISLAEGLAATGRFGESMNVIDDGIHLVEVNGDLIYMTELLRVKGVLLLSMPQPRVEEAEMLFVRSLELSRQQGARAGELRTAIELAKLMAAQGRREDARKLLEPVFTWFVEGLDTDDLKAAERLLTTLR